MAKPFKNLRDKMPSQAKKASEEKAKNMNASVNITELKKNPMAILKQSKGKPVAVLNRDVPIAYLIPTKTYEKMLDILEDYELGEIVRKRQKQIGKAISIKLEDL